MKVTVRVSPAGSGPLPTLPVSMGWSVSLVCKTTLGAAGAVVSITKVPATTLLTPLLTVIS